jgi:hypothetical protein
VRAFLSAKNVGTRTRGPAAIWSRYDRFGTQLPRFAEKLELEPGEIRGFDFFEGLPADRGRVDQGGRDAGPTTLGACADAIDYPEGARLTMARLRRKGRESAPQHILSSSLRLLSYPALNVIFRKAIETQCERGKKGLP